MELVADDGSWFYATGGRVAGCDHVGSPSGRREYRLDAILAMLAESGVYGRASVQGKRDTSYSSRNATTGSTVAARREGKYDAAAVTISIRIATLVYTAGSIGLMSKSSVSI